MTGIPRWRRRRGDVTVGSVFEGVFVVTLVTGLWFACAGLIGVFVGVVWRVAKWVVA